MSKAHTWLARSMARPRNAYGNTGCAGCFLLVLGLRYSAWIPMRRISVPTWRRPTSMPCRRRKSRSMRLPANGCSMFNSSTWRISAAEHACGALHQLPAPLRHLVRVHVVLLRDLDNRLAVGLGLDRHLGPERRRVVTARSSAHALCSYVSGSILAHRSSHSTLGRVQICAAGSCVWKSRTGAADPDLTYEAFGSLPASRPPVLRRVISASGRVRAHQRDSQRIGLAQDRPILRLHMDQAQTRRFQTTCQAGRIDAHLIG